MCFVCLIRVRAAHKESILLVYYTLSVTYTHTADIMIAVSITATETHTNAQHQQPRAFFHIRNKMHPRPTNGMKTAPPTVDHTEGDLVVVATCNSCTFA